MDSGQSAGEAVRGAGEMQFITWFLSLVHVCHCCIYGVYVIILYEG